MSNPHGCIHDDGLFLSEHYVSATGLFSSEHYVSATERLSWPFALTAGVDDLWRLGAFVACGTARCSFDHADFALVTMSLGSGDIGC